MARTFEQIMTQVREEQKHMHLPPEEIAAWEDQAIDAAIAEAAQEELMQGLYEKYHITKTDGSPVDPQAQYFVLRLDTDPVARIAAMEYARACEADHPKLAEDLRVKIVKLTFPNAEEMVDHEDRSCLTPEEMGDVEE